MPKKNIATIWISGVTASGKTTLGQLLYDDLINYGINYLTYLDGDILRKKSQRTYGYSSEERFKAIKEYIKIVKAENDNGNIAIISTVSHRKESRFFARKKLTNFFEINLLCEPKICKKRDYKDIYSNLTRKDNCIPGVTEPYETYAAAEIILDTGKNSIESSQKIILKNVLNFLSKMSIGV